MSHNDHGTPPDQPENETILTADENGATSGKVQQPSENSETQTAVGQDSDASPAVDVEAEQEHEHIPQDDAGEGEVVVAATSNGTVTVAAEEEDQGTEGTASTSIEKGQTAANDKEELSDAKGEPQVQHPEVNSTVENTGQASEDANKAVTQSSIVEQATESLVDSQSSTLEKVASETSQAAEESASEKRDDVNAPSLTPDATTNNSQDSQDEAASTTTTASAPGPSSAPSRPVIPKKFTSSLSMNKKFLEKSGAAESKSTVTASVPAKAGPVAGIAGSRSPSIASPPIPGSVTASPTIAHATTVTSASSSAPRLLTGKLSALGTSTSVSGGTSSPATWGRPASGSTSTAFGKSSFVPAPSVGAGRGGPSSPPNPASDFGRGKGFQFGRGPPPFGRGASSAAPWGHKNTPNVGRNPLTMGASDFPSFQETARAEQQRQNALLAKERADKMAAAAQAAYNQRVLEGLKSFSGVHSDPNAVHWDEMDEDEDLEDILEFADGTKYEVPAAATLPTAAEAAAFEEAARAESEAAILHAKYEQELAAEAERNEGPDDKHEATHPDTKGADFFQDDFDRGNRSSGQAQGTQTVRDDWARGDSSSGPGTSGRTLYNDRLGRFEPYAGRPTQTKKDRRTSPPALLQRSARGAQPDSKAPKQAINGIARPPKQASADAQTPISPSSQRPPLPSQGDTFNRKALADINNVPTAPKRTENAWARPPVLPKELTITESSPAAQTPSAQSQQASTVGAAGDVKPSSSSEPVDPEAEYKKEMQAIAERARKRRQEEEAERQAQVERARKKAAELEERLKKAESSASTTVAMPSTSNTSISKPDRTAPWRRTSISAPKPIHEAPAPVQQRTLLQPPPRNPPVVDKPIEKVAPNQMGHSKAPPTSASLSALADFAFGKWKKTSPTDEEAKSSSQTSEAAVVKRDSTLPSEPRSPLVEPLSDRHAPAPSHTGGSSTEQPRVRLGKSSSPTLAKQEQRMELSQAAPILLKTGDIPPHAFPQPTIIVPKPSARDVHESRAVTEPELSALDKIMLQVKAAQSDLKAKEAAAALEESRKQSSSNANLDGALSRISQALGETASRKERAQEKLVPSSVMIPPVPYIHETFDITQPDRPPSPRGWRIFTVRLPTLKRQLPRGSRDRFHASRSPHIPIPVSSSTWAMAPGSHNSDETTLERFLFPRPPKDSAFVVKVSRFHTQNATPLEPSPSSRTDSLPHQQSILSNNGNIDNARKSRNFGAETWRRAEDVTDEATTSVDAPVEQLQTLSIEEEDFLTVRLDDNLEPSSNIIKVSLPKASLSRKAPVIDKKELSLSPELNRFRTYGPKLPENSTVAFRRSISANREPTASESRTSNMFMVSSEIQNMTDAERKQEEQASLDVANLLEERPSIQAEMMALVEDSPPMSKSLPLEGRSSPNSAPSFPSLSNLPPPPTAEAVAAAVSKSGDEPLATPFGSMRREDLPKHVLEELERLNATVSSAPLTAPSLLDSPSNLMPRTNSPWTNGKPATAMNSLSMSAIDPSMSLWSKPTEETAAAAAAAAFSSTPNATKASETSPNDVLKGMSDELPSSMPRSAHDLGVLDGDGLRTESQKQEAERTRRSEERIAKGVKSGFRLSGTSPVTGYRTTLDGEHTHHRRPTNGSGASSRHGSFGYPSGYGQDAIPSPYAVSAALPYATATNAAPQGFSPTGAPAYSPFVSHGFAQGYPTGAGMPSLASTYSHMPVGMNSVDARVVPTAMTSPTSLWMPSSSVPSLVTTGHYAAGVSPYLTSMGTPMQGYGNAPSQQSQPKSRLFPHQGAAVSRNSPVAGAAVGYSQGGSTGPTQNHLQHHPQTYQHLHSSGSFPSFSPSLSSPGITHTGLYGRAPSSQSSRRAAGPGAGAAHSQFW